LKFGHEVLGMRSASSWISPICTSTCTETSDIYTGNLKLNLLVRLGKVWTLMVWLYIVFL